MRYIGLRASFFFFKFYESTGLLLCSYVPTASVLKSNQSLALASGRLQMLRHGYMSPRCIHNMFTTTSTAFRLRGFEAFESCAIVRVRRLIATTKSGIRRRRQRQSPSHSQRESGMQGLETRFRPKELSPRLYPVPRRAHPS